jgi:hypothetical protein
MQLLAALLAVIAAAAGPPSPPHRLTASRIRPRPGAVARGTAVRPADLFTTRVFPNASFGFALASVDGAQYPARTEDGGKTWRIDGPQVHIDAADGAEGVGFVGATGPRTFFAYGSSAVDVTTDRGRTWVSTNVHDCLVGLPSRPDWRHVAEFT